MTVVTVPSPDALAVALWRLLALALAPATPARLEEVAALAEALAEIPDAPKGAAELLEAAGQTTADTVAACQARLFAMTPRVSPYEGGYEDDPFRQARQMADVAGFYRAFGAESQGPAHEKVDHAGCELEFLYFLGARRLEGVTEDERDLLESAENAFLSDHAGRWLPSFFRALEREAEDGFHRALGSLGAAAVAAELDRRGIVPEAAPARARRLEVEADGLECGGDSMSRILTRRSSRR